MNNEEKILAMLEQMNQRLDGMATKESLDALQADVTSFKADMADGFEKIHGDIGRLYESSDKNMKLINEGLGHLNERYAQLDQVEQTVDDHGNRIFALEQKAVNG